MCFGQGVAETRYTAPEVLMNDRVMMSPEKVCVCVCVVCVCLCDIINSSRCIYFTCEIHACVGFGM